MLDAEHHVEQQEQRGLPRTRPLPPDLVSGVRVRVRVRARVGVRAGARVGVRARARVRVGVRARVGVRDRVV